MGRTLKLWRIALGLGILSLGLPQIAVAQDGSGARQSCEMHVWPGSGLNSVYYGWLRGGIVNGAVTGRNGYPAVSGEPLTTANQVELLTKAQPHLAIESAATTLVVHPQALSSRVIRSSTTRIAPSTQPCYSELIVDDVFFQQDIVNGSYLKVSFRYRAFSSDTAPRRTFGTWVKTKLLLLPLKPGADPAPAAAELRAAFVNDIALFAKALRKASDNAASR